MIKTETVLAIGAHTDDIELGCGALLGRLMRQGSAIHAAAFSVAEASLPPGFPPDALKEEFRESMSVLGLDDSSVIVHRFPVRRLAEHRQEILELLVQLNQRLRPDVVLTMNARDTHQDHAVMYAESVRAFRQSTLISYQTPWNQQTTVTDMFVEVAQEDVDLKIKMLAAYRTQHSLKRTYVKPSYVQALAEVTGQQGRLPLAESFSVEQIRWGL